MNFLFVFSVKSQVITPIPTSFSSDEINEVIRIFLNFLKILNFSEDNLSSVSPTFFPSPSPSYSPSSFSSSFSSFSFSSLREIFKNVGEKTGVPWPILEAVMQIESPSTFSLSQNQIREYSLPGKTIPGCRPNECSATGPMQMTIGIDNFGNPLCPKCCWQGVCRDTRGGCPNAWARYGSGNPCNLLDNIFAAARKLKNDSQSTSSHFWSKEEVYRASRLYYGNCTVKYKRLGDRSYCEFVWWYYQSLNEKNGES